MAKFFTRERFGTPQVYAGLLLLAFVGQCLWLSARMPLRESERAYIEAGRAQWRGERLADDLARTPLTALIAGAPAALSSFGGVPERWPWLVRLPFTAMAALLGASLWYVARRLYGNTAGYIALALYAFSPVVILRGATVNAEVAAAWGAFGAVFTAIAVSHTLYAPREVVLWNWRRILLLGLAVTFAVGAQFSLAVVVALALGFMLYVVPERRGATLVILAAACVIAGVLLWATYFFRLAAVAELTSAAIFEFSGRVLISAVTWSLLGRFFLPMPGVLLLLLVAVATFASWPRTRFFGTAAPLITTVILIVLGLGMPHVGGYAFLVVMLPFAFVFTAGVFADLLETRASGLVLGIVLGVLLAHAFFSVRGLIGLR